MTREAFMSALRKELLARYGQPNGKICWANNPEKLEKFLASTWETLETTKNGVNIDGESFTAAWRAIGGKGKPTYKALRALPAGVPRAAT